MKIIWYINKNGCLVREEVEEIPKSKTLQKELAAKKKLKERLKTEPPIKYSNLYKDN